jgi:ATP-dependent Clp protease ATP-binding subunit ClpC
MVRIDMSELQHADGVERLVGDDDEHSGRKALVHRIREQPFAVVLFDEIEKAHPAVFDLFLQLFDEGRLADRRGVPADFRHTLIILTSNVGVKSLEGSSLGFAGKRPDLLRALEGTFRRELLNRIDRIVAFRPLDRAIMRKVLKKELDLVLARRGFAHRPWVIEWDEQALEFLLEEGFTPELGARPLRRAIERHLLAPLATAIVAKEAPEGEQFLFVGMKGHKLTVEFVSADGEGGDGDAEPRHRAAGDERPKLVDVVREGSGAAGEVFVVAEHLARLRATIEHDGWHRRQADALAAMGVDDFWRSPARFSVLGRVELMDRMARHLATSVAQAQQLWGKAPSESSGYPAKTTRALAERVWLLEAALQSLDENEPQDAFLAVRAVAEGRADKALVGAFARELAAMYRAWAERRGMEWTLLAESAAGVQPFEGVYAVSGLAALRLLAPEDGLHAEKRSDRPGLSLHVRVLVVPQPDAPAPADPKTALEAARRALLASAGRQPAPVRSYRRGAAEEVRDRRRGYRTGRLDRVLGGEFDVMG